MKSSHIALATLLTVSVSMAPLLAHAQSANGFATRAQVRADLVALQSVGYSPNDDDYPANIQSAERLISAKADKAALAAGSNGTPAAVHTSLQ